MAAEIRIIVNSQLQGGALGQVAQDMRAMDQTARQSGGGFSVLANAASVALGNVVAGAAQAAAGAMVSFVGDSVSAAASFEAGMNQFAAAAGGSLEAAGLSVQDFEDLFMGLGAKLPVSTAEVQEAAIALIKGGIDPAIIAAGGLESSLNFAAGAGMGLEQAAELSVKMLGTFTSVTDSAAEKTAFMAEAQDLLVKAANASTLNVDALGDAMLAAGGQARAAGLDYEDFVTAMGLISPAFGSAAEAGTSFKNMLVRLQPSTQPAIDAMTELGLITAEGNNVFYDAQGNFLGMENAAEQLQNAFSGLSEQERLHAMQTIFGNDAMGAAAALADGGSEAYRAFAEQMANANGVTEQAAAVNQGFGFAMQNLSGTIEVVQLKIGGLLLPVLTTLAQIANSLINAVMGDAEAFAALPGPLQEVVTFVQSLAAQFMALLPGIQAAADILIANWQPAVAAAGAVIGALIIPALASMVVAFAPVMAAIAAAVAVGALLMGAWQSNFFGIQQIVTSALTAVQAVVSAVLAQVLAFWQANGAQIMAFAQQAWTQIQQIIAGVLAIIASLVTTIFTAVAGFIQSHGTEIQTILTFVWNTIANVIGTALGLIQGVVNTVLGVVTGDWQTASDGIQGIVDTLVGFVQNSFTNLLGLIQGLGPSFMGAAAALGHSIVDGIVKPINDGVRAVADAARKMVEAAINAAKDAIKPGSPSRVFTELGLTAPAGLVQAFQAGAPQVYAAGAAMAGAGVAGARQAVSQTSTSTRIVNYSPTYNRVSNSQQADRTIAASLAGV